MRHSLDYQHMQMAIMALTSSTCCQRQKWGGQPRKWAALTDVDIAWPWRANSLIGDEPNTNTTIVEFISEPFMSLGHHCMPRRLPFLHSGARRRRNYFSSDVPSQLCIWCAIRYKTFWKVMVSSCGWPVPDLSMAHRNRETVVHSLRL